MFTCVREEENKKKEAVKVAVKKMGTIAYYEKQGLDMANAWGEMARKGKELVDGMSDDSSLNSQACNSPRNVSSEEDPSDDDGVLTQKDIDTLNTYSRLLQAKGLFDDAVEAKTCLANGMKPTFAQILGWDTNLKWSERKLTTL
jgi:hypothetical protein